jgi:hypothetical protein
MHALVVEPAEDHGRSKPDKSAAGKRFVSGSRPSI